MSKKINKDVSFSGWVLRFFVSAALLGASLIFIGSIFTLVSHTLTYAKKVDESKLVEHAKEVLVEEESIIFLNDKFTEKDVNEMIDEVGINKVNDYIMIEIIALILCLMLTICKCWNMLTPLLRSNLKEPFTDENIKSVSLVVKYEVAIIIICAIATIIEETLFMMWGSDTLSVSNTLSSYGSISTVIVFIIFGHILKTGKEKIELQNK